MVAVQTIKLVQNEDEVDSLKFFKEQVIKDISFLQKKLKLEIK